MQDCCGRIIDYLRISVTDRCNFRCAYCMPTEGVQLLDAAEILSYEELLRIITVLGGCGVNKIRLTGGEPLVRKDIVDFIRSIRALGIINDLSMTTNGSLLSKMATELRLAGLDRVNISIDTIDSRRFTSITGRGDLQDTLDGIKSAMDAGLAPVKLNVVLTGALTENDVLFFIDQVYKYPITVRFIEYMPVGRCGVKAGFSIAEIIRLINSIGRDSLEQVVSSGRGNGPAKYYRLNGAQGMFGFITPMSHNFCNSCNRIRLSADGKFKPCLLSNQEFDVKTALRKNAEDSDIRAIFIQALQCKPNRHQLGDTGYGADLQRGMSQIGG